MERANCLENAKLRKAPPNPITSAQTMSSWLTAPLTSMPNAGRTKFTSTWKVIERVTKISTLAISSSPTPFSHFIELLLQAVWQIRNAWKRPVRLSDRGTLYNCGGRKSSRPPAAPVNAGQITSFRSSSRWGRSGLANPPCSRIAYVTSGAWRAGGLTCSRVAHSGLIRSGHRRMECSVDARSEGQPSRPPLRKMRGMVCRVPGAVQHATGDDARSLRLPGHQSEEQRKDHAVPGTPPLRRSRSRSYRTWLGRSKGYAEGFLG